MSKCLVLLFAAVLPFVAGCTSLSNVVINEGSASDSCNYDIESDADALTRAILDGQKSPGMIIGLHLPNGEEKFLGYGRISESNPARPGPDTITAVGSLTKGLVGALAQQLVDEGVLKWNDTLGSLLPAGTALSKDASHITVLELATHTSGLPRQPNDFGTLARFIQYLFTGKDFYRKLDEQQTYAFLADWTAPDVNGDAEESRHQYSNVGYALLARVLELKAGKPLDALLQEKITSRYGMHRTGFDPDVLRGERMSGHVGDQPKFMRRGSPVADWRMNAFMQGTGGIYSTARDMLTYAAQQIPLHRMRQDDAYTVAWHADPLGNPDVLYQFGVNSGHSTFVGIDTRRDIAVVVLQNNFTWTDAVGRSLMKHVADTQDARHDPNSHTCKNPELISAP